MIEYQSGVMEEGWPSEKKVLPALEQIEEILLTGEQTEEILPRKMGEQTVHIRLSVDVPEDSSDTSVGEQEVLELNRSNTNL